MAVVRFPAAIERLLVFDHSPGTIAAMMQHLARADHPELVSLP